MKKYAIVEGVEVTADDIDEARKLDQQVYDEEYYVTLQQCLDWNARNNKIYTMLRDPETGRIIAYVNLSPVTDEYYEKIKSGEFIDTYLPPEAIVSYEFPDLYNLYFSSVVVHPDYQDSTVLLHLFNAITQKFMALGKEEILIKRMVADAVSEKGQKFCELFGMKKQRSSSHDSTIYEVQMLPPRFRISSKPTRELYNYYSQAAIALGLVDDTEEHDAKDLHVSPPRNATCGVLKESANSDGKVFISYSSKEKSVAEQVCDYLESKGLSCWIAPRDINPGENYATQIVHAIRNCFLLVLLASNSTNVSGHVSNEVSLAFDSKKTIVPFKIEDVVFSDEYLYFLGRKHWIEAHRDMSIGLEQLYTTITRLSGEKANDASRHVSSGIAKGRQRNSARAQLLERSVSSLDESKNTDYSKIEIVDVLLQKAIKYSDRGMSRFADATDYNSLKIRANRFLKQCMYVTIANKRVCTDDPIGCLCNEITGNQREAIKIVGLPGSGKSVLLQAAFFELLMSFREGKIKIAPFYISLGYLERRISVSENAAEQSKSLITGELKEYFLFLKNNADVTPIVFVNGIREHVIGKVYLENILMDVMREHGIRKCVVSVDSFPLKDRSRIKRVIPLISGKIPTYFETHNVDAHDESVALDFVSAIIDYYDCNVDADKVFSVLKTLKFQELDAFITRSIADELLPTSFDKSGIADLYEKWALTAFYGNEDKLLEAASKTFEYIYRDDFVATDFTFSDPQWCLIHQHSSFIAFLISYYIVRKIDAADESMPFSKALFSIMLTASTDTFVSAFLKNNYQLQSKVLRIVVDNYASFSFVEKSSANFWLAKITLKSLIAEAAGFLKPVFEELKPIVKKSDNTTQENYNNQFFFRSICFTLINYGQAGVLDDYLCLLVTNDSANAINRGAIIEYHSDLYRMVANDTYCTDSDIKAGASAIKALLWKINRILRPGTNRFPEMDLLTLTTLLQKRIQSSESKDLPEIQHWVSDCVSYLEVYHAHPQNIHSEKIEHYFSSIYDDFKCYLHSGGDFDISQRIYNSLRSLKDVKRWQWESHNVPDPESISEHSFSAWMLAMLFLPEELPYDGYAKREVLDMLLIHDMAEVKLSDQTQSNRFSGMDLSLRNKVMRQLFIKGTYPNMANLTYYYNVWTGYYNGININAKIARDVNAVQAVYTFCEYYTKYPDKFTKAECNDWMQRKEKLETEIGFSIYKKLIENNTDFASINGTDSL